nr:hypothetical protein [Rubripirellula sp.]
MAVILTEKVGGKSSGWADDQVLTPEFTAEERTGWLKSRRTQVTENSSDNLG